MKHAHRIVLTLVVAALVAFALWHSSCRAAVRAGAAGAGAVLGSAIGPAGTIAGAGAGAVAADPIADALGADKEFTSKEYRELLTQAHRTIAELQAREPIKVPVPVEVPKPFVPSWVWRCAWAVAAFLAFRFRHGLLALAATLLTGGVKPALLTLAGLLFGGKVADRAKAAVAAHEERRPRAMALRRLRLRVPPVPPAVPISQETKPHDL